MENKIIELFTYFIIYSFLGWILESVYKTVLQKKPVNSGFLYGPFCPIYGVGAIIMYLFLEDFKGNPFLIFCLGFVILSVWEYAVGVFLEKFFKTRYWDYSENKYNLQGRVCLKNSIFWGILGIVFITFIHPFICGKLMLVNPNWIIYFDIAFVFYFIIDVTHSAIAVNRINQKLSKLHEINQNIKERLEEMKQIGKTIEKSNKLELIQAMVEELNEKREELKNNVNQRMNRLKKAFPSMNSEKLSDFWNQKIEIRKKEKKNT